MLSLHSLSEILEQLQHENFYWRIGFYGLIIAATVHTLFIPLFLHLGIPLMAGINVVSLLLYLAAIFVFGIPSIKRKDDRLIGWMVYAELTIHNTLAAFFLSREAGFQLYLYLLLALPFFTVSYRLPTHLLRALGVFALVIWVEWDPLFDTSKIPVDVQTLRLLETMNQLVFLSALGLLSYLYSRWEKHHTRRIEHDLMKDPLTGLNNRRYLDLLLKECGSEPVGLMLLDIDRFKELNDNHGHDCGDVTLKTLAKLLKEHFHDGESMRWGGEEFLLVYTTTDKKQLISEAERLRSIFEKNRYRCKDQTMNFTLTVGSTLYHPMEESFTVALARADRALYRGKQAGKNCVKYLDA